METDRIQELEKLLEQMSLEVSAWKSYSRKWEQRSKKNYAARKHLERELTQPNKNRAHHNGR